MKNQMGKEAFFRKCNAFQKAKKDAKKTGANNKYGEYIDTSIKEDKKK